MTCTNACVVERCAFILTDTVAEIVAANGAELVGHQVTKIYTMPHGPFVVAARGDFAIVLGVPAAFALFQSFDEAAAKMATTMRAYMTAIRSAAALEIIIGGWSHSAEVAALFYAVAPEFLPTFAPCIIAPALSAEEIRAAGVAMDGKNVAFGDDPGGDLCRIMEKQREICAERIGGAAVLTTITKDEIRQRVLRRW
jgi:hypothetical protein